MTVSLVKAPAVPDLSPKAGEVTTDAHGTMMTGSAVHAFRYLMLRRALKLEMRTGMKMSRGMSPLKVLKAEGITKATTKAKALADLEAWMTEAGIPYND